MFAMKIINRIILAATFTTTAVFCSAIESNLLPYQDVSLSIERRVADLIGRMTLTEKIGQMAQYVGEPPKSTSTNYDDQLGYNQMMADIIQQIKKGEIGSFLKMPGVKEINRLQQAAMLGRLKIPLLFAEDAVHGIGMDKLGGTIYPSEIGMASSFDTALIQLMADYTRKEMLATGLRWAFSPNIEVAQDPRWGRFGDTFGEDPLLVGLMGVAMIKGLQGDSLSASSVLACAKHFIAGSIPVNGLNGAAADVSDRTLAEVFYPPFQRAINAGVYSIMPAHNEVNGIPCHANGFYMQQLIRNQWGFGGFFISDWNDVKGLNKVHRIVATDKDAYTIAVNAGLDMNMHGPGFLESVKQAVNEQVISIERINEAVTKILTAKFKLGLFENPYTDENLRNKVVLNTTHKQLALKAAEQSIVLLKNKNGLLPLSGNELILVTGPNANNQAMLGDWSVEQKPADVVTMLQGIQNNHVSPQNIAYYNCGSIFTLDDAAINAAVKKSAKAAVNIVFVGENSLRSDASELRTSGENIDRSSLDLPGRQLELLKALKNTKKPLVVVFINGAPISSVWCHQNADAIIEAWEPGTMGGQAVANVLFGKCNPSGKLPVTIVRSAAQIRTTYYYKPSAYHRGKYRFDSTEPLYAFGFGLSYTSFNFTQPVVEKPIYKKNENVVVTTTVTNTGKIDGTETVQLYVRKEISPITRPIKQLKAFKKIHLKAGESKVVRFEITPEDLLYYNVAMKPETETGVYTLMAGNSSDNTALKQAAFTIK